MAKRFKVGKVVFSTNDGEVVSYDSIDEAYEKENIELSRADFVKALGTDKEVKSGVTAFRYGVDIEATEGYDEALSEAEQYAND